jgi:serine/threonine-protein kinase RsbT
MPNKKNIASSWGNDCPADEGAPSRRIQITNDLDIVAARVEGRNLAKEIGFGVIDQARIATAISELARNVVLYAHSGEIILNCIKPDGRLGLQIICTDHGPGIRDLDLILDRGRLPSHELGMGLPGTRRLMDEFDIETSLGIGTTVTVCKWLSS